MFSHYFIVIAVNLITIAFKFLENKEADPLFTAMLMCAAMGLFYVSVFSDSIYYDERFRFGRKDVMMVCIILLLGGAVICSFRNNVYGFLLGAFIAAGGNFIMLMKKYKYTPTEGSK